jgi:transcriptional regulator with XRE-family HTH domain
MTKSQIFNRTQMGRTYIYQIFSNKRHPSRDKLLQIAMAMQCTLEETQNLLLLSQYSPLSFRNKRDLIIAYCLHKRIDTFELNAQLYDFNEEPLFNEE